MGLLSRAVSGGPEEPAAQGGLFKLISQKQSAGKDFSFVQKEPAEDLSSPLEKAVTEKLSASYAKFGAFQGIILEAQNSSAAEFAGRLAFMISVFGLTQGLAPGRCLVLFASNEDRELIGEHLAKTVPGTIAFSFKAGNPGEAFSLIESYL